MICLFIIFTLHRTQVLSEMIYLFSILIPRRKQVLSEMIYLFIIFISHRTQVLSEMNCFQASLDFFVENWALDDFCVPVPKEVNFKVLNRPPALRFMYT